MIRMRAVPDDFDNVQALHSPYGAVHGIGASLSPSTLGPMASSYGNHGLRSPMVDIRRPRGQSYMSPTGLSHSFGGIDLGQSAGMANSDMESSSNSIYHDRCAPGVTSVSTPGVPYRTSTPYWNSTSSSIDSASHFSRPGLRDAHPLQARDWNSRQAPEAVQSPLSLYPGGGNGGSNPPTRQMTYSTPSMNSTTTSGFGGFESQAYSSK